MKILAYCKRHLLLYILLCLISLTASSQNLQVMKSNTQLVNEQLSSFAFIIGQWECEVNFKTDDNETIKHKATWTGRYILNGHAIEDEYRETDMEGNLIRLGINIRSYNAKGGWIMKWFDALNSSWLDLGPQELGGVDVKGSTISFKHFAENNTIVKITFYDITRNFFWWKADISNDLGETWEEKVYTINAKRIN